MKRTLLLSIGIMALLFTACNKNEYSITPDNFNTTIKAVMNADETKSTVSNYSFYWSAGDKINVWYAKDNSTRPVEFTLSGNGGVTSGTFTGTTVEGETCTGYAVYPSGSHSMTNGAITVNMPAVYGNNNTEYVANTNAAMIAEPASSAVATNTETTVPSLYFKHVGGVLAFTIKNVPADANQFIFTANMPITGAFTVANNQITATEPAQDATVTNNTVTINFKPLTAEAEAMTFYVPLPTGTYKGFKAEVKTSDGNTVMTYKNTTANTLNRAGLAEMTLVITDVNAGTPAQEVSTTASLKNALINGGSYVLTSDLTIDEQLSMNSSSTQTIINLQNNTLTLQTSDYGIVNYAGSLILKNGNIVSNNPQWALYNKGVTEFNNINFTLSNCGIYTKGVWEDGKTIQNYKNTEAAVKFTVEGGSITSTATAPSGTNYYAVSANDYSLITMKNTTITGSGSAGGLSLNCAAANLSNVTINGGTTGTAHDVWVRTGLLTTDNSTSYDNYLYSASGDYGYTEVNGKLYGPTANEEINTISDVKILKAALATGGSYSLSSDVTVSEQLKMNDASKSLTIDLNNKTLTLQTSDYGIVNYAGSLILKNGNIVSNNPQWALYNKGVTEFNNINFTLSNCGIYTKGVWEDGKTIQNYKNIEAAVKFTVEGGSITSTATAPSGTNYYAVYANDYSLITMKNTTITGSGSAGGLSLNCAAANLSNVTINGGTTGTAHDVWVRTGLLTTDNSTSYDNYLYSASGNSGYTEVNGKFYGPTANQEYDSIEALESALQNQ